MKMKLKLLTLAAGLMLIASEAGQPQALINDGPSITDEGFGGDTSEQGGH